MGGGIVLAEVGFGFDDTADEAFAFQLADEEFAEETAGNEIRRAEVKTSGK
jgi:hypothetical protein